MKNRYLGIVFILLITACGVSFYLYSSSIPISTIIPVPRPATALRDGGQTGIQTTTTLDPESRSEMTKNPTTEIKPETPATSTIPTIPQISITLKILDKNYEITVAENSTVYETMKKMMDARQIQFSTQEYSGLGHFVEEINGVKNNKQAGIYWFYYLNNQPATIGISNYHLKPNDIISWKYDKAQF